MLRTRTPLATIAVVGRRGLKRKALWVVAAKGEECQSSNSMGQVVLWFKNDLRLHDNYVVDRAQQLVKSGKAKQVLPVYCFDPRHYITTPWGNPKTGNFRAQFLLESILDLKQNLRNIGSDLLIKFGKPEEILPGLLQDGATIVTQEEFASEEQTAMKKVKDAVGHKARVEQIWDSTLYHLHDLPFAEDLNDMGDVFTPVKNKIEGKVPIRELVKTPRKGDLPISDAHKSELDFAPNKVEDLNAVVPKSGQQLSTPQQNSKGALDFKGGESVALKRLQYYVWDTDLVADYFNIRNGMLGGDYSTKFSPWLAHGCISPRLIHHEICKYESQRKKNKSTYWVTFELTWRDYFRFFLLKHGNAIFQEYGIGGKDRKWNESEQDFQRWKDGQTGMPLIDANMRELKETGFMSNRGRQNVASYLALDLEIDWRKGADWFESVLHDYDVASNWGNWMSAAGMTNGGRISHFNTLKQSKDYDEDGKYVKHWVPELANVPVEKVHQPWQMTKEEEEASGVVVGRDYPKPPKSRFSGSAGDRGSGGRGRGRGGRGRGRGGGRGGRARGPKGPQE